MEGAQPRARRTSTRPSRAQTFKTACMARPETHRIFCDGSLKGVISDASGVTFISLALSDAALGDILPRKVYLVHCLWSGHDCA